MRKIILLGMCMALLLLAGCKEQYFIGKDSGDNITTYWEREEVMKERCNDICGNHTINSYSCSCGYCYCTCEDSNGIIC